MARCGDERCSVSTGIHEGLTFGRGPLDFNGFWSIPCSACARDWEANHPEDGHCWPFAAVEDSVACVSPTRSGTPERSR